MGRPGGSAGASRRLGLLARVGFASRPATQWDGSGPPGPLPRASLASGAQTFPVKHSCLLEPRRAPASLGRRAALLSPERSPSHADPALGPLAPPPRSARPSDPELRVQ